MWRSLNNYLHHLFSRSPRGFYPLLGVQYLTYACRFRCPYCSDGEGRPYWALPSSILGAHEMLELLARLRRHTDHLVLTGGEPLEYPELDSLLAGLGALRFDSVIFTTNGYALDRHLEALRPVIDHLVVSIDTLGTKKADAWYGAGPGTQQKVLENLDRAARRPRPYEIIISSVATPDNLHDLHAVYDFARQRGFRFAVCPQLCGVKPHPALAGNSAYRALFDRLIHEKRRGASINGSLLYLEHMRDLRRFRCRTSAVVALSPTGDVFYPCLEIGKVGGNLRRNDLHQIRAAARAELGPEPVCDNRCHSACALGFALLFERPTSLLSEARLVLVRAVRAMVKRLRGAAPRRAQS